MNLWLPSLFEQKTRGTTPFQKKSFPKDCSLNMDKNDLVFAVDNFGGINVSLIKTHLIYRLN